MNVGFSPILLIVKKDLDLTYTQSAMLTTAYFIGYTIGQIPWGYLTDRMKSSKAILISVLCSAIIVFFSSVAPTGDIIIVTRFFAGLLGAGIFVPSVRLISAWFPSENRGLALGLFGAGTSIGGVAVSFSSPLIALSFEWRWSIRLLTFLGFSVAFMIGLWLRDSPQTAIISKGSGSLKAIVSSRAFWILGYDQLIRLGLTYAASAWLPTFVSESYGLSTVTASLSLTLMNVIGIFSNPGGGIVSDRIGEIKSTMLALASITPAVFLLAAYRDITLIWVLIVLIGFFINFLRSPLFSILPKIYGLKQSGVITGYQNTFASAGAFLFPFIIGSSRDISGSFTTGWVSLAILCLPALLSTIALLKYDKSRSAR